MHHPPDPPNNAEKISRLTICDEIAASPDRLDTLDFEELRLSFHALCRYQLELESENERLRQQAEQELARARYFNLYDLAPVGYYLLDESDLILEVNTTAALLLDKLKDQMVGQPFSRYVHPEDRELYRHHCRTVRHGTGPMVCELRLCKKDGTYFWAHLTANMQQTGRHNEIQMVVNDMTEPKLSEEQVRRLCDSTLIRQERSDGLGPAGAYGHPPVGTTPKEDEFIHYLPASTLSIPVETTEDGLKIGEGKILVMDDDELICTILDSMLQQLGYTSETALEGEGALAKYVAAKQSGAPFDAVIMDLVIIGGMGGRETMEKLLLIDPQAKVIVSSGYTNNSIMREYRLYGFSDVMKKPYRFSELRTTLQRILASKDNASSTSHRKERPSGSAGKG